MTTSIADIAATVQSELQAEFQGFAVQRTYTPQVVLKNLNVGDIRALVIPGSVLIERQTRAAFRREITIDIGVFARGTENAQADAVLERTEDVERFISARTISPNGQAIWVSAVEFAGESYLREWAETAGITFALLRVTYTLIQ